MNIYIVLYYSTAKDMEWPVGTEPRVAYYCPGGFYSQPGIDRTISLYNPDNLKCERVESDSILDAYYKFTINHPGVVVVTIGDERVDNQPVAVA